MGTGRRPGRWSGKSLFCVAPKAQDWGEHRLRLNSDSPRSQAFLPGELPRLTGSQPPASTGVQADGAESLQTQLTQGLWDDYPFDLGSKGCS